MSLDVEPYFKPLMREANTDAEMLDKLCALVSVYDPAIIDLEPHCTAICPEFWVLNDDPECRPFKSMTKCWSDARPDTFEATDPDGNAYTSRSALMAVSTAWTSSGTKTEAVEGQIKDFYILDPASGTVGDHFDAAIAAIAPTGQFDDEAAPVPFDRTMICDWTIIPEPCGTQFNANANIGVHTVPNDEGADGVWINGKLVTSSSDPAKGGVSLDDVFDESGVPGTVIGLCITFRRERTVKA